MHIHDVVLAFVRPRLVNLRTIIVAQLSAPPTPIRRAGRCFPRQHYTMGLNRQFRLVGVLVFAKLRVLECGSRQKWRKKIALLTVPFCKCLCFFAHNFALDGEEQLSDFYML